MEIKRIDKEKLTKKAKVFFHSQKWNNILVFFIFVILAFCFWIMQYFQQKIERDITISIHYTNIPNEIILNDSTPEELTVRISDKGTAFLKYYYNKENLKVNIDLQDISLDKNTYTIDRTQLNYKILDILSNTTQLLSFKPENLQVRYSPLQKKELPIHINGKISPAPGYIFTDSLHIEPAKVWVYGDKKGLDTLQYISTINIKKENIQKDLKLDIQLELPKGTRLSAEQVNISSRIEEYTEKVFELPVICHDLPENTDIRFFPSTVEVTCQIALSKYSLLTEKDLMINVNFNDIIKNPGTNVTLDLTQKPEWMISYRIVPETIEFLIEKN